MWYRCLMPAKEYKGKERHERAQAEGRGRGRQTLEATKLRKAGRHDEADAIAPPSERHITPDQMCGARTQKPGNPPCTNTKGAGTDHPGYAQCSSHGGNTPAVIKSAMRLMAQDIAVQYKANWRFGGDRTDPSIANVSPEDAMLEEVRRSVAMVRFLEERIARWNLNSTQLDTIEQFIVKSNLPLRQRNKTQALNQAVDAFMDALPDENPDSPYHLPPLLQVHDKTGLSSFTDLREWLFLYREERAHLARVSKMTLDAGVAARLVSLAEDQGRILASAIRAVLDALQLTPEQARMVPLIVPPILRAVASNSPLPSLESLLTPTHPRALPPGQVSS